MDIIMDTQEQYSITLKWMSDEYGLTQEQAGQMAGVVQSAISHMLKGDRTIHLKHLKGIAAGVGITVEDALKKAISFHKIKESLSADDVTSTATTQNITKYERNKEHHATVDKFKNQETALAINQMLVQIEAVEPNYLDDLKDIIEQKFKRIKKNQSEPDQGESAANQG